MSNAKFEVYVLLKTIGESSYTSNVSYSHHICYMKEINGSRVFFTHLQTENGDKDGRIQIEFGSNYRFFDGQIFYLPIGKTTSDLNTLKKRAYENKFDSKAYQITHRNCQTLVKEYIDAIGIIPARKIDETDNRHILGKNIGTNVVSWAWEVPSCSHPDQMKLQVPDDKLNAPFEGCSLM